VFKPAFLPRFDPKFPSLPPAPIEARTALLKLAPQPLGSDGVILVDFEG
jgi:hypothetical protein